MWLMLVGCSCMLQNILHLVLSSCLKEKYRYSFNVIFVRYYSLNQDLDSFNLQFFNNQFKWIHKELFISKTEKNNLDLEKNVFKLAFLVKNKKETCILQLLSSDVNLDCYSRYYARSYLLCYFLGRHTILDSRKIIYK